jgi:hypothetical protein
VVVRGFLHPLDGYVCRQEHGGDIAGGFPCFLVSGPFGFAIAPVCELAGVQFHFAIGQAALPDDGADVVGVGFGADAVLGDDADGEHTFPALVPGFEIEGFGQAAPWVGGRGQGGVGGGHYCQGRCYEGHGRCYEGQFHHPALIGLFLYQVKVLREAVGRGSLIELGFNKLDDPVSQLF